jgi:CHASE2 domain-containing sensor protein
MLLGLGGSSYGALLWGLWMPFVPAAFALVITGGVIYGMSQFKVVQSKELMQ